MLYISNLYKSYGSMQAVSNLNLHIPKGELFGFVGPNGAGKTTTIRIVCGLLRKDSGSIKINGIDADRNMADIKKQIGYVPDFFGVYDNLKVMEYMDFYGSMYGMTTKEIYAISNDLLELVNLSDKKDAYVDSLSRGMKQRLCVARALIHNPELLILDEPSSGLDPRARIEMKELLMNLNQMGKTIVISSHILSELAEMCTSVGIMNQGRLVTAGKMEDILTRGIDAGGSEAEPAEGATGAVGVEIPKASSVRISIRVISDTDKAVKILRESAKVTLESIRQNEIIIRFPGTDEEISRILYSLVTNEVMVTSFHKEEQNLENIFMELTKNGGREE